MLKRGSTKQFLPKEAKEWLHYATRTSQCGVQEGRDANNSDDDGQASYRRRALTETANSMLKRGMGDTLRGNTVWQQARHFYAKCFTHNMLMRC